MTKEQVLEETEHWALTGELPPGHEIRAIDWRRKEYEPGKLRGMLAGMFASGRLS